MGVFGGDGDMKTYFLFSGGLDSVVALDILSKTENLHRDFALVFVDYKQAAAEMEYKSVLHWAQKYGARTIRLDVRDYEHLLIATNPWIFKGNVVRVDDPSNKDALFLPGRNIYLLSIAAVALYNNREPNTRFLLATHREDLPDGGYNTHGDCCPDFFRAMEASLSLGMSTPTRPMRYEITSVVKDYTKAELIDLCAERDIDISKVWSCYGAGPEPCGECQHCLEINAALGRKGL